MRRLAATLAFSSVCGCSATLDFGAECSAVSGCVGGRICSEGYCVSSTETTGADRDARRAPDASSDAGPRPGSWLTPDCPTLFGATEAQLASGNVVLLGTLLPSTGALGSVGPSMERAVWLAVDQLNQLGGLDGRRFAVLSCDDGTGGDEKAGRAAAHLIEVGVQAIVGPAASSTSIQVLAEHARAAGVVLVSPSATSPDLTEQFDDGLLWRTAPSDLIQGAALSAYLRAGGFERVAVVNRNDTYGNAFTDTIRRAFCPDCTVDEFFTRSYDPAAPDAPAIIDELEGFAPDVTVLIAYLEDGLEVLSAAEAATTFPLETFVLADGMRDARLLDALANDVLKDRLFGTAPASPVGETFVAFTSEYAARWGAQPGVFNAQAYDATYLLAYAIAAAGPGVSPAGASIARNLTRLSAGPRVEVGRAGFLEGVRALRSTGDATIDFHGASGPLDFDPRSGEAPADIEGWRLDRPRGRIVSTGVLYTADGTYTPPSGVPAAQ